MIIHHKNLKEISLGKKNSLKYSEDFEFVPLRIFHNGNFKECIFQTPKLFLPYGKQRLDNGKYVIDVSFQNKDNDKDTKIFLETLKEILHCIKEKYEKYENYNVNSFLKKTKFDYTMRLKVSLNSKFYDNSRNHLYKIDPFSYGTFIIGLEGLWIHNNEIWFQWYLLQARLDKPKFIDDYAFIEENSENSDKSIKENVKYIKMRSMGVPEGAIELQKQIDVKTMKKCSIPPPPPPPPCFMSNKTTSNPVKIKASDLQSVVLKKSKYIEKKKIYTKAAFEPPSIEELQTTLSNLKKIL